MGYSRDSGGPRFVDPSVDPSLIFDSAKYLVEIGVSRAITSACLRVLKEVFSRFPSVEYAVGFDGTDDLIRIGPLNVTEAGFDVEMELWVSETTRTNPILSVVDDRKVVAGLFIDPEGGSGGQIFYRKDGSTNLKPVPRLGSEVWQNLRVWSDGQVLSVEIEGEQSALIPNIDLTDSEYRIEIGKGHTPAYLDGMMKALRVLSGDDELLNFRTDEDNRVPPSTESLTSIGVSPMRKQRFDTTFKHNAPHSR